MGQAPAPAGSRNADVRSAGSRHLGRRLAGMLLGTILATLVAWSPPAVQPAFAAGSLGVRANTTYTVDPDAGRVHVAITYTVTNNKPNTATIIYYYRELTFGIQPDSRAVRASDSSGSLAVSTRERKNYTEVEVRLRANLYYRRSTTFTLRYDLVGGAPRSETPIRVGKAFATFGVWAFGDRNKGTVEVRVPSGYTTDVQGDELPRVSGGVGTGTVLRAKPTVPDEFFAIVSADNDQSFAEERISLPGGVEIIVMAWPEDDEWGRTVATTMERGVPRLQSLIGLDWPVFRDLLVRERYTPALEGYAGVFFEDSQTIEMSEDLDPATTLHEASHAWFNDKLFRERWITEGLAEVYSYRVHEAIADVVYDPPIEPDPEDPAFVRLNVWVFPAIVRDDTDAKELYGYAASLWLVDMIVDEAGVDRMREAFRTARENLTAYPGTGTPEKVTLSDGWKRFLDLTQPIDEEDPAEILEAIETFVLAPGDEGILDRRAAARDAYRKLLADPDGWVPPWYVRGPLGEWKFEDATTRIAEAEKALALREQVEAAAAAEGLVLDDSLRLAYEGAQDGFAGAEKLAADQLAAIAAIAAARVQVDATPDFVAQLGLMDQAPRVPYEASRAAFESGDLGAAVAKAGEAGSIIAGAPAIGQQRLLMGVSVAVGLLVLLLVALLLLRRRRRRARAAVAVSVAAAAPAAAVPPAEVVPADGAPAVALEPSATLGADPVVPAPPFGEAAPDPEGGPART